MSINVTVGICVKDGAQTLSKAIASIIEQDYYRDQLEIIFVDDGSEDDTLEIMNDFANKNIIKTKVFSFKWRGLGYARNTVYKNANGKYIIWVDCDNILDKSFISKAVFFMDKNKNIGIGVGKPWIKNNENPILFLELVPAIVYYYNRLNWNVHTTKLPGTAGTILRVEAIKQIGGFDDTISYAGEDQDVAQKIMDNNWFIGSFDAIYYETKGDMDSMQKLWAKYIWYGMSSRKMQQKNIYDISLMRSNPIAGFLSGVMVIPSAYLLFHRKILIFSPLFFSFKMFAWILGYIRA